MALLKLYANRSTNSLVASVERPDGFSIPPLVQGDTISIQLSVVEDNPTAGIGAVSLVNLAPYSLKIGLGTTPTGSGGGTVIALQTSWTLDSNQTAYTGELSLNTAEVTTFLGTSSSRNAHIEIELKTTATGAFETVYIGQVEIRAQLITTGSTVPIPGDTALGSAEAAATYVPKLGAAGGSIVLTSSDGTKQGILYWGDDGAFHAESL